VIGISPQVRLVDGTVTTQPEYAFWFHDVGWGVENYGTDPDIVIDNRPQEYINGQDAQLERAIKEIETLLSTNPPSIPSLDDRPAKTLPKLPSR
jgi:tricorn protease